VLVVLLSGLETIVLLLKRAGKQKLEKIEKETTLEKKSKTSFTDLHSKICESLNGIPQTQSRELTEDEKRDYPLQDYDYSKEEQQEDEKGDRTDFHFDTVRLALRPENYSELKIATISDVRRHDYSDIFGIIVSIYGNAFTENGELYLPIETLGYPNFMVRKYKPNKATLLRLKSVFGPDPKVWHECMGDDKPYGFDALIIYLRVDNGTINGYTESDIRRLEFEVNEQNPACSS
jgi:hypothetical protein